MNVDEILEAVEQVILTRQLSLIERFVLRQSWLGRSYGEMAQDSAYGIPHLKEVGSQLWYQLSEVLGERVTKKNLHLVVNQYQQSSAQQEFQASTGTENLSLVTTETELKFPGSSLPYASPLYVNRPPVEELVSAEIHQPGCVIHIKAPRRTGKSSLLNRVLAHAAAVRYSTVYLDFQEADKAVFSSLDKFLRWFCANVSRQLNLNLRLDEYWDEEMGSKVSCKIYFEGYVLKQINRPIVLVLNEVNQVFEHPEIAQDFLQMLRFWHELARTVEAWQKLRTVVSHSTEVYVPLKLNQSPFNVGLPIGLPQFVSEQVQDLAQRYGLSGFDESKTQQLMAMVGGHPYLVSVAFYYLRRGGMTLEALLQAAPTSSGVYSDHLRGHLTMLREERQLALALQQVVGAEESVKLEAIAAYKLDSLGLVQLDGNQARVSCQLYRLYFQEQLREGIWLNPATEQPLTTATIKEQLDLQDFYSIDRLTELSSRRYFNQYLESQWRQWVREIPPLSLILCDVDYFKYYNNTHSHLAGDACLQLIATAIRNCVGDPDAIVARYGGEEFAVILPQTVAQHAVEIAQEIRERVKALGIARNQPGVDGFPASVLTVSVGVASTIPSSQNSPVMLIAAAEKALSLAKREGRDRVALNQETVASET